MRKRKLESKKRNPAGTLKGPRANDTDHWLSHLLKPDEILNGSLNPVAFFEKLKFLHVNEIECWGLSGRLHSVAKGTIRQRADDLCHGRENFAFVGIVTGLIADIRNADADVAQTTKEPSHATLFFADPPMMSDLPSMEFINDFIDECLKYVPQGDPDFSIIDTP